MYIEQAGSPLLELHQQQQVSFLTINALDDLTHTTNSNLKMNTITPLFALLAMSSASPLTPRFPSAELAFNGAAGASYNLIVPLNGIVTSTNNDLSIASITSTIDVGSQCGFQTVDHPSPILVEGPPGTWVVGPPQSIISVYCYLDPEPPAVIEIEFDGAADAKYTLSVPLDGSFTPTTNVLSISTLVSSYDITTCTFEYVDGSAALSSIGADTWAVGPPQTIIGVSC